MPQSLPEPWVLIVLGLATIVVAALVVLVWVSRSPAALDDPWVAAAAGLAIIILAAVLWPLYPILLLLLLPAALVALVLYLFLRRKPTV